MGRRQRGREGESPCMKRCRPFAVLGSALRVLVSAASPPAPPFTRGGDVTQLPSRPLVSCPTGSLRARGFPPHALPHTALLFFLAPPLIVRTSHRLWPCRCFLQVGQGPRLGKPVVPVVGTRSPPGYQRSAAFMMSTCNAFTLFRMFIFDFNAPRYLAANT